MIHCICVIPQLTHIFHSKPSCMSLKGKFQLFRDCNLDNSLCLAAGRYQARCAVALNSIVGIHPLIPCGVSCFRARVPGPVELCCMWLHSKRLMCRIPLQGNLVSLLFQIDLGALLAQTRWSLVETPNMGPL